VCVRGGEEGERERRVARITAVRCSARGVDELLSLAFFPSLEKCKEKNSIYERVVEREEGEERRALSGHLHVKGA
jgi:hypothetical protein